MNTRILVSLLALLSLLGGFVTAEPLGTAFTYQGHLTDGGQPGQGIYDLRFTIYDALADGNVLGGPLTNAAVAVTNGLFTVALDFGSGVCTGEARWLEIGVRTNGSGAFSPLSPRQPLTAAPYALYAPNAGLLEGQDSSSFAPAAGSTAYVAKTGDTMTGRLHLPADGLIVGAEQLALTNGKVGIGTAAPAERLEVAGNLRYSGQLSKLDTAEMWEAVVRSADFKLGHSTRRGAPGIVLGDAWPNLFVNYETNWPNTIIESKVGIQTRTPAAELDVNGTVRAAALEGSGTSLPFRLSSSETMRLERDSSGSRLCLIGPGGWGALSMLDLATYDAGTNAPSARIRATDDNWSSELDFLMKQQGASSNALVSRLRLRPNGNVQIDPTSSNTGGLTPGLIFGDDLSGEGIASARIPEVNPYGLDFYTAYQPRLSIDSSGRVGIGKTSPSTALDVAGTVTATMFAGSGAALTNLAAASLTGTVDDARLSAEVALLYLDQSFTGVNWFGNNGNVFKGSHYGDGSHLTALDASNLTTGTVPDGRLSLNVAQLNRNQTFTGANSLVNNLNTYAGDGTGLSALNASSLTTGKVPDARLSPNVALLNSSPTFTGTIAGDRLNIGRGHLLEGNRSSIAGGQNSTNRAHHAIIGGGYNNNAGPQADFGTIAGGENNTLGTNASESSIGGGSDNQIETGTQAATVGGGTWNRIGPGASRATIAGGDSNTIETNADAATISGGSFNLIGERAVNATIGGGNGNLIEPETDRATIAGGGGNQIGHRSLSATIVGGEANNIETNAAWTSIGGGRQNAIRASAAYASIGGGGKNEIRAEALGARIGGGWWNEIHEEGQYGTIAGGATSLIQSNAYYATIGGGNNNQICTDADSATIAGGTQNTIETVVAGGTIGGGSVNTIQKDAAYGAIGGGSNNMIQTNAPWATIGGGLGNTIGQLGQYAVIPGGRDNTANGRYSLAAGQRAMALHIGSFVWADSQTGYFTSVTNDTVCFRCQGGVGFSSGNAGSNQSVHWEPGDSSWSFTSDRALKESFVPLDKQDVLEKVARLPITEWNFKGFAARHIGPMAQDFHALFPLNNSETTLNSADLDGVALAAIQGLHEVVQEKDAEIQALKHRLDRLEQLLTRRGGGGQ